MEPYQERVVEERRELAEKIDKLTAFVQTAPFAALGGDERSLLVQQQEAMSEYLAILTARIRSWGLV